MFRILAKQKLGTVEVDQQIANTRDGGQHPHEIDIYIPAGGFDTVIVALHGGGGAKGQYAAALGILTSFPQTADVVVWGALTNKYWRCALIVPQGQHCKGVDPELGPGNNPFNPLDVNTVSDEYPRGIPTWSNHVMWSSVDDMQFLKDMAAYIEGRWPGKTKILGGHSNGGIMANRMWYEDPTHFDYYCGTSGPAGIYHRQVSSPPPAIVKPFLGIYGAQDTNLSITDGRFYNDTWQLSQLSKAFVQFPALVIGELDQLQFRVDAYNDAHGLPPETVEIADGVDKSAFVGSVRVWSYSGGANRVQLYDSADHSSKELQLCAGRRHVGDWCLFALLNPPD